MLTESRNHRFINERKHMVSSARLAFHDNHPLYYLYSASSCSCSQTVRILRRDWRYSEAYNLDGTATLNIQACRLQELCSSFVFACRRKRKGSINLFFCSQTCTSYNCSSLFASTCNAALMDGWCRITIQIHSATIASIWYLFLQQISILFILCYYRETKHFPMKMKISEAIQVVI